ncbi:hypothetical protein PRIPAC_76673 [Pristionchus pacificus]|uniref:Uncharacterized protein n=1 Tax=Pristionchus pacificus TaxID=54126 RepID=A0A2A6BZI6_PRIPA|nr:hypothetical protein PRIPAC_76673 [Pristionchus pacificus]|eukprot:PDM71269.1 hypothetical protein PRIPAC_37676 [Pristionchus pacificus]
MYLEVGAKPVPLPYVVDDDFISRFALVDGLKKGRFLDSLRRIYEIVGAVDCYGCPNTFIVGSKKHGHQLLKAIKHGGNQSELYTMQGTLRNDERWHQRRRYHLSAPPGAEEGPQEGCECGAGGSSGGTEVAMLLVAEQVHPCMRTHLMVMTDRGTTKDFSYIIMNRPGPTLEYICRNLCEGRFTTWTVHHIAIHTIMALRDLHHAGFVLRDVSLQSFCIGFGRPGEELIFINQALAIRPYIDSDGALLRSANKSVHRPFSPYCASRARLRDDSNCFPQQDVEAWLWMMMCLYDSSWLPLDAEPDRAAKEAKALEIKESLWKGAAQFPTTSERMPASYRHILSYLRQLQIPDRVGYEHIRTILDKCTPAGHPCNPLDWQGRDQRSGLTEKCLLHDCPRNKADADGDRTVTIRRDPHMAQQNFYTSRVVTTLQRRDASIESRSKTTVTEQEDKNPKMSSGPIAAIPDNV